MSEQFVRETLNDLRSRVVTPENADLIVTASSLAVLLGSSCAKEDDLRARNAALATEVSLVRTCIAQMAHVASRVIDGIDEDHISQADMDVLKEMVGWDSSQQSAG